HEVGPFEELILVQFESAAAGELYASSRVLPCSGDARQHRDCANIAAPVLAALHAIVHTDHRGKRSCILAREFGDVLCGNACPRSHTLRWIVVYASRQLIKSIDMLADVIRIVEILTDDDIHHAEGQR